MRLPGATPAGVLDDLGALDRIIGHAGAAAFPVPVVAGLDPLLHGIVRLTAVRRSPYLFARQRRAVAALGVSAAMADAIEAEDWTDPVFVGAQKEVFRFAMMYDAGHGVGDAVFAAVEAAHGPAGMVQLAAVANYWCGLARLAIMAELTADE
jgi:hypothetical protein